MDSQPAAGSPTAVVRPEDNELKLSRIAWWTGISSAALTGLGTILVARFGLFGPTTAIYVSSILAGVAGAAIGARHPRNPVGWLLIGSTAITALFLLDFDYGYVAVRNGHALLPLTAWSIWLASWLWVVPFGISMPAVLVRMPEGRVRPKWWFVDRLTIAGTLALVIALAVTPGPLYPLGLAINPIGMSAAAGAIAVLRDVGLLAVGIAMTSSVASVLVRLRTARGDEFQQLEWIAFGAGIVASSVVIAGVLVVFFHVGVTQALTPFALAVLLMPVVVGVAMLRYRLYDVDVIINRTLVYGGLTAILAGFYAALVTVGQRFFIAATGQKSDAAVVISAFAIASVFTPVRDGLQSVVSRHVSPRNPKTLLGRLQDSVNSVVAVLDGQTIAQRLLTEATTGYSARYGALYLEQKGSERLVHEVGDPRQGAGVEVPIRLDGMALGRLVLGERRGGVAYSHGDLETLQQSADAIARALVIAGRIEAGRAAVSQPS